MFEAMLTRLQAWPESHPRAFDWLLAGVLLLLSLVAMVGDNLDHGIADYVISVALVAPLPWRRRAPVATFAVTMALCLVQAALAERVLGGDIAVLVSLYTVAAYARDRRWVYAALAVSLAGVAIFALRIEDLGSSPGSILGTAGYMLLAAVLGSWQRNRLAQLRGLRERARLLAVERDQQAEIGAARERTRIARELHDVVAHSLSVIVVQADGGRYAAARDGEAGARTLQTIADTARDALAEMRRALGILRPAEGTSSERDYAPQPGAAELSELVRSTAATGLPVALEVAGDERPLPAGVDVTVYRIVQEALTNVLKHAGAPSRVDVTLRYLPEAVEISVRDDGGGPEAPGDGRGQGLLGMRERAELHGGTLRAGPREGGGFEVRARVPAAAPAARRTVASGSAR